MEEKEGYFHRKLFSLGFFKEADEGVDGHAKDGEGLDGDKEKGLIVGDELRKGFSFFSLFWVEGYKVVDVRVAGVEVGIFVVGVVVGLPVGEGNAVGKGHTQVSKEGVHKWFFGDGIMACVVANQPESHAQKP